MIKYQVQKQENEIVLVEQNASENTFPMIFTTDVKDEKEFKPLIGKYLNEDEISIEEVFIYDDEGGEFYQLVAKLK